MKTLKALKITSILNGIFCLFCIASIVCHKIANYQFIAGDNWRTSFDIAIDLQKAVDNPGSDFDVVLRAGDVVSVPKYNNTVKITGGVMMPHVVTYDPKMSWKDYVGTSGGFVKRAMKNKSYFVYMNGTISTKKYGKFKAEPGCELVVPERKAYDRERATLAQSVSIGATVAQLAATILYLFK